jgi:hypothetical protein
LISIIEETSASVLFLLYRQGFENLVVRFDKCVKKVGGAVWTDTGLMSKHIPMLFLSPLISIRIKKNRITCDIPSKYFETCLLARVVDAGGIDCPVSSLLTDGRLQGAKLLKTMFCSSLISKSPR